MIGRSIPWRRGARVGGDGFCVRLSVGVDGPAACCLCQSPASRNTNWRPSMTEITRIAIDTSKSVFTLHAVDIF